jgi:hypothetical protein
LRRDKADVARGNREAAGANEEALAGQIFQQMGGRFTPQAARAAAHRALQNFKQTGIEQASLNEAIMHTIEQINQDVMQMQNGMRFMRPRLNRIQAQRPGMLGVFGN